MTTIIVFLIIIAIWILINIAYIQTVKHQIEEKYEKNRQQIIFVGEHLANVQDRLTILRSNLKQKGLLK